VTWIRSLLGWLFPPDPGGLQPLIARSSQWPAVRRRHLAQQPACQVCDSKRDLEVHHILPLAWGGAELEPSNLNTLCARCHLFIGHLGSWQSRNPDYTADAAAWRAKVRGRPSLPG
jgi:5-methylcytosine-specific restriction protein A